jgi:hypothetical protein
MDLMKKYIFVWIWLNKSVEKQIKANPERINND